MGEKIRESAEQVKTTREVSLEMAQQVLHSLGLYDASNDFYPSTDHDDESWAISVAN